MSQSSSDSIKAKVFIGPIFQTSLNRPNLMIDGLTNKLVFYNPKGEYTSIAPYFTSSLPSLLFTSGFSKFISPVTPGFGAITIAPGDISGNTSAIKISEYNGRSMILTVSPGNDLIGQLYVDDPSDYSGGAMNMYKNHFQFSKPIYIGEPIVENEVVTKSHTHNTYQNKNIHGIPPKGGVDGDVVRDSSNGYIWMRIAGEWYRINNPK